MRRALADRLSAASALAAGVAHELNNPLAYVTANLAFLAEQTARLGEILSGAPPTLEDAELAVQLQDAMREARSGAERMRSVIRDLKTFAGAEDERRGPVDLQPVLDVLREHRVERDPPTGAPVAGPRAGGTRCWATGAALAALPEPPPQRGAGDPGGAPGRPRDRAQQPGRSRTAGSPSRCATPAPASRPSTSRGSSTRSSRPRRPAPAPASASRSATPSVAAMGGEIKVESALGKGSTFRVLLAAGRAAARDRRGARTAPPRAPRARVLVVDDEPLVGAVLRRTLVEHDVTVVESARAALDRIAAGERYDLVLSDLLMPGLSGMDLYRELVRARPAARSARRVPHRAAPSPPRRASSSSASASSASRSRSTWTRCAPSSPAGSPGRPSA